MYCNRKKHLIIDQNMLSVQKNYKQTEMQQDFKVNATVKDF